MGTRKAFPTSTTLGDSIILTFVEEKEDHSELREQIREQEMKELITAVEEERVYRPERDASPELKKMKSTFREKGTKLRKKRYVVEHIRRF